MLRPKIIIKLVLRYLFELSAVAFPYGVFLVLTNTNTSDGLTVLGMIFTLVYCIISILLFDWCFDLESQV